MTGRCGLGKSGDDGVGGFVVERRFVQRLGAVVETGEQRRVERLREDVHRHVDEHRARLAVLGQQECLLDDLGKEFCPLDPPRPFDERPVDLELRRVGVQVHLLVGMTAVVVRRHVAGDDHHGDAIERGVGDAGRRVRQARTEVTENDRGPPGDTCIPVGGVRGDLLVPYVDELDTAAGHRRENGDVGVPTQAEDVPYAAPFQVADELFGCGRVGSAHGCPPVARAATTPVVGRARMARPL